MGPLKVKHKILTLAVFCGFIMYGPSDAKAGCSVATHDGFVRGPVTQNTSNRFTQFRQYIAGDFFTDKVLPALMLFTEQMTATAMQQTMSIGMFLDSKHQLETQRLISELQFEAHRDYQPSDSL